MTNRPLIKIYILGNSDNPSDNAALVVAEILRNRIPGISFQLVAPNQDLPFEKYEDVILIDNIEGIKKVVVFDTNVVDHLALSPRNNIHDYDANFQLKYLKKLGRLGKVTIVGIPRNKPVNYKRIQSILRKLVAQDMHGS
jgi:hypothetical protein